MAKRLAYPEKLISNIKHSPFFFDILVKDMDMEKTKTALLEVMKL